MNIHPTTMLFSKDDLTMHIFNKTDDKTLSTAMSVCKGWKSSIIEVAKSKKNILLLRLYSEITKTDPGTIEGETLIKIKKNFSAKITKLIFFPNDTLIKIDRSVIKKIFDSTMADVNKTILLIKDLRAAHNPLQLKPQENTIQIKEEGQRLHIYDKQVDLLTNKLESGQLTDAFQYYDNIKENPFLSFAFIKIITNLLSKNKLCEVDQIKALISDPYIKQHVESVCVCNESKDLLNGIDENIRSLSYEECQMFEINLHELVQGLHPVCSFFVQGMLTMRYLSFPHGLTHAKEIIKTNPQNYLIGLILIRQISYYCQEHEIEKAEDLFSLLKEERELKQARIYIQSAKNPRI